MNRKSREPVAKCFSPPREGSIWTTSEMIKKQVLHMGLFGESFMIPVMKGRYPVKIELVNPLMAQPKLTKDGKDIQYWEVTEIDGEGNTKKVKYPVDKIVQWKRPNPYSHVRGLAPLTAARLAVEQDLNMATWNAVWPMPSNMQAPATTQAPAAKSVQRRFSRACSSKRNRPFALMLRFFRCRYGSAANCGGQLG